MIQTWVGTTAAPIAVHGQVTAFTNSSATVQAYESRGTLLLTTGSFQAATATPSRNVPIRVICN